MPRVSPVVGWLELALGIFSLVLAGVIALSLLWAPDPHGFAVLGVVTIGGLGLALLLGAAAMRLKSPRCWLLQLPGLAYAGWFVWFLFG